MLKDSRYLYVEDVMSAVGLQYAVEGNRKDIVIDKVSPLESADEYSLTWIKTARAEASDYLSLTKAKLIICPDTLQVDKSCLADKCLIMVAEPKLALINVLNKFFKREYEHSIHKTATISPRAKIGDDVYIGANVFIGDAEIGNEVIIEGNSFIYDNTVIKKGVVIQAGAVIGSDGFGHFKDRDQRLIHFPHIGKAVLYDEVVIGSNSVVDRGVLGETVVGDGTKINNLCTVSHNVIIGKNNFIAHGVSINGSAKIGDNNYIGSGVTIRNKVVVGSSTVIGMGSVVINNVLNGTMVYGNPAKPAERKPNKSLF